MRIPFIQRVGIGLHLGRGAVRWVELEHSLGRVRLRRLEVEPVVGNKREAALHRLLARLKPRLPVATHLDPEYVRVEFVEAPAFDDDEDLRTWLGERPRGTMLAQDPASFVARTSVVSGDSADGAVCSLALAREHAITERVAILRRAGLVPGHLGTGVLAASSALAIGGSVESEQFLVVAEPDSTSLLHLREGRPARVESFGAVAPGDIMEEARTQLHVWEVSPGVLFVTGMLAEAVVRAHDGASSTFDVRLARPAVETAGEECPGPEASVAVGLAAEALFPGLALVDFLDERDAVRAEEVHDKHEGQRAVLVLGSLLLALLLFSMGTRTWLSSQIEQTESILLEHADELVRLDEARERTERLRADLRAGRALISERTQAAVWIEALGRAVPEGVHLTELRVENRDLRLTAALTGLATTDDEASRYVSALERHVAIESIRLLYTERLSQREVERFSTVRTPAPRLRFALEADLVQFDATTISGLTP